MPLTEIHKGDIQISTLELNPREFVVSIHFKHTSFDAAYPSDMNAAECEKFLLAAMRIVQLADVDPWVLIQRLNDDST